MATYYYQTEIGKLGFRENEGKLRELIFEGETFRVEDEEKETPLLRQAFEEVDAYLKGKRSTFTVPFAPDCGTAFQRKVWDALCRISYGAVKTYKEVAIEVGSPKGARAVGLACNRNPIALIIPCHRVVGTNGSLTGFGGGIDTKKTLLSLEQESIDR